MRKLWLLMLAAADTVLSAALWGQSSEATEKELTDLYRHLLAADVAHDTAALAQVLAPTYRFIPPVGDPIMTREDRIASAAGDTTHRRPLTLQGCQFQLYEPTAVGQCRYTWPASEDSTVHMVSLVVFNRSNGRWQIVATHPSAVRTQRH